MNGVQECSGQTRLQSNSGSLLGSSLKGSRSSTSASSPSLLLPWSASISTDWRSSDTNHMATSFGIKSTIQGGVYKTLWTPVMREELMSRQKTATYLMSFWLLSSRIEFVVGHVPQELERFLKKLLSSSGGCRIFVRGVPFLQCHYPCA